MKKIIFGLFILMSSTFQLLAQNGTIPKNNQVKPNPNVPQNQESLINNEKNALLVVTTVRANLILTTSASIYFSVMGSPIAERGVCWSTGHNPTISNSKNSNPSGSNDSLSVLITNLKPNTTYYLRAYAKSGDKVFYGNEITFKTKAEEENSNPKAEPKNETKTEPSKK
jgi:hypothetical protein